MPIIYIGSYVQSSCFAKFWAIASTFIASTFDSGSILHAWLTAKFCFIYSGLQIHYFHFIVYYYHL